MIALFRLVLALLATPFRSKSSLEAENAARQRPSQPRTVCDRNSDFIAALDQFVVPTVDLRMLFALVVDTIDRRLMVTINVTTHPTADWMARQVTEAFPWNRAAQ